jgi:hypothetical protein
VKVEPAFWEDLDVQRLTADQEAEIRVRYGGKGETGTPPSAADISVVLVARDDDGTALGCGALRELGDGVAEVKRMYVAPVPRGRGYRRRCSPASGYRPIEAFGAYVGASSRCRGVA